jgi:hypothetical protein
MTLMPDADYAEVMAALPGDLPLVPVAAPLPGADRGVRLHVAGGDRPAPAGAAAGQGAGRD